MRDFDLARDRGGTGPLLADSASTDHPLRLEAIRALYPLSLHGVGLSLGSAEGLQAWRDMVIAQARSGQKNLSHFFGSASELIVCEPNRSV